jgi:nucleotide-binding universal stress UspA family protein
VITRILLAVDDSPAGLAAARVAVQLAETCRAELRAVTVLLDGLLEAELVGIGGRSESSEALRARRGGGQISLLHHVEQIGHSHHVEPETAALLGQPAPTILADARDYRPDVIVIGRSDRRRAGEPYVGSEVRHVLEFAEVPVLVVPADSTALGSGR